MIRIYDTVYFTLYTVQYTLLLSNECSGTEVNLLLDVKKCTYHNFCPTLGPTILTSPADISEIYDTNF